MTRDEIVASLVRLLDGLLVGIDEVDLNVEFRIEEKQKEAKELQQEWKALKQGDNFCGECGTLVGGGRGIQLSSQFLDVGCVAKVIDAIANDQPFTVVFMKRDGEARKMACIRDRDKAVVLPQTSPLDSQVKVWDREKDAPRTFNLNKVARISIP